MKWHALAMNALILNSIVSCSSVSNSPSSSFPSIQESEHVLASNAHNAPKIPFDVAEAFYPLRRNKDGKIVPTFQWDECVRRFVLCTKWEVKRVEFTDAEMEWALANGMGLFKLDRP